MHALESEIVYELLESIHSKQKVIMKQSLGRFIRILIHSILTMGLPPLL